MSRKLDRLWCWRCDAETSHAVHLGQGEMTLLICDACGHNSRLSLPDFGHAQEPAPSPRT